VEGDANTIVTANHILGGVNLNNNSRANAIEIVGANNVLEIRSGYAFSGKVVHQGSGGIFALGGATDVASFDLSSIGIVGSGTLFQGFSQLEKRGTSTWTVSGVASGIGEYSIDEGVLKLTGSGDLSNAGVEMGDSAVLDISGIAASKVTISNLVGGGTIHLGNKSLMLGGGELAGTISGTSSLTITGEATLSGVNISVSTTSCRLRFLWTAVPLPAILRIQASSQSPTGLSSGATSGRTQTVSLL
jgi:hypothetical protein